MPEPFHVYTSSRQETCFYILPRVKAFLTEHALHPEDCLPSREAWEPLIVSRLEERDCLPGEMRFACLLTGWISRLEPAEKGVRWEGEEENTEAFLTRARMRAGLIDAYTLHCTPPHGRPVLLIARVYHTPLTEEPVSCPQDIRPIAFRIHTRRMEQRG